MAQQTITSTNPISLYSESFGTKENPAIILNAGAGSQAIIWPEDFCAALAARGYFVIRYDYRDCGLSPAVDYDKNPYTVLDLADDAINLLKQYDIKKAHFLGFSLGGQLAQLVGAYRPEYALSLILIGTSSDFKPGLWGTSTDKTDINTSTKITLSTPSEEYSAWVTRASDTNNQSLDEKINNYVETVRLQDGKSPRFNRTFFAQQAHQVLTRTILQSPYINHAKAMQASCELHEQALEKISLPTLIIHGNNDPVFPPDHGKNLHDRINHSEFLLWDDFAHAISPQNFDRIIQAIDQFIKKQR